MPGEGYASGGQNQFSGYPSQSPQDLAAQHGYQYGGQPAAGYGGQSGQYAQYPGFASVSPNQQQVTRCSCGLDFGIGMSGMIVISVINKNLECR